MTADNSVVDLMAALRRSVDEAKARREAAGEDVRPFIPPVLDREAQEQLIAEDRAADRRAETLRTFS